MVGKSQLKGAPDEPHILSFHCICHLMRSQSQTCEDNDTCWVGIWGEGLLPIGQSENMRLECGIVRREEARVDHMDNEDQKQEESPAQ